MRAACAGPTLTRGTLLPSPRGAEKFPKIMDVSRLASAGSAEQAAVLQPGRLGEWF